MKNRKQVRDVRNILESITTESRAVDFIDSMMAQDNGPELMLDVYHRWGGRWWGVFYRDWC